MKIHQIDLRLHLLKEPVGHNKGRGRVIIQIHLPLQIADADLPAAAFQKDIALPGLLGREVHGPEDLAVIVQIITDLPVAEGVVAQGDHIRAGRKDIVRQSGRDAAACRVFTVDHRQVCAQPPLEQPKLPAEQIHAGLAHHIADGKNDHSPSLSRLGPGRSECYYYKQFFFRTQRET